MSWLRHLFLIVLAPFVLPVGVAAVLIFFTPVMLAQIGLLAFHRTRLRLFAIPMPPMMLPDSTVYDDFA
jgi:hypothetical protein